jgi:hypothetical protein
VNATVTPDEIRLESERRLALSTVVVILCMNLAIMILDLRAAGPLAENIPPVVIIRLFGVLVACALTAVLSAARTQRALEVSVFMAALSVVALVMAIRGVSTPSVSRNFAFDLVFIPTVFVALPGRPWVQLIPVALLGIAAGVRIFDPAAPLSGADRFYYGIIYIASIAMGYVAASRRDDMNRQLGDARNAEFDAAIDAERAKRELQTLRGIIPICSHCSRVRIEEGRLWEAVDMYVSRLTDAAFSHGVCPDCLAVHYPNVRVE